MELLEQAMSAEVLARAWDKVKANQGAPGADHVTLDAFDQDVSRRLRHLGRMVLQGRWQAWPLLRVALERPGKKPRFLAIPTVRDRVLHTALALVLSPLLEREFETCSYAYRPGRSLQQALSRVQSLRDQGFRWVVDADIQSYFDEVDHATLLAEVARYVPDARVVALIRTLCRALVRPADPEQGEYCMVRGIAQGSPLSPLLANLYLDSLDEILLERGLCLVRFADDFLVLCRDKDDAEDALEITETALKSLSLKFNAQKTRIINFDQGFHFLGAEFLRDAIKLPELHSPTRFRRRKTLPKAESVAQPNPTRSAMAAAFVKLMRRQENPSPPTAPASAQLCQPEQEEQAPDTEPAPARQEGPPLQFDRLLRTLYLNSPGLYLHRDGERIVVERKGEELESLPGRQVGLIVLSGNQAISTGLLEYCARHEIGVFFQSPALGCYASMAPYADDRVDLHRAQFRCEAAPAWRLATARAIAQGKLANQRLILRRQQRRAASAELETGIAALGAALAELKTADSEDAIRGHEGAGAKAYFSALQSLLPSHWRFSGRNRQPPTDAINAMLSYGYAVLYANVLALVRRRGLNAHLGVLHSAHHGQPALASDLMEEFRPLVVDAVVLRLALSPVLAATDFHLEDGMCRLSETAKRHLVSGLENKLNAALIHPLCGTRMDYRRALQYQVQLYARAVLGEVSAYHAMVLR